MEPISTEIEVPQVYRIGGRYYLVCCSPATWLLPSFKRRFPGHRFRDADYAMVGASPTGPFTLHGTGEILPARESGRPYASRLVRWQRGWYLLGTVREGRIPYVCDPIPVIADATGIHAV